MLSPELRKLRARVAVLQRHTPDHPDLPAMREELLSSAAYQRLRDRVAEAPPLTDEQREELLHLLKSVERQAA